MGLSAPPCQGCTPDGTATLEDTDLQVSTESHKSELHLQQVIPLVSCWVVLRGHQRQGFREDPGQT